MLTLIVEDHTPFRQFLADQLHQQFPAMRIAIARSEVEFWGKIQDQRPDFIFMDIYLPDCNGLDLTRKIKAAYPNVAIIIMSNYDLPEYQAAARANGASGCLTKGRATRKEVQALISAQLAGLP